MLNDIRLHVDADETSQQQHEHTFAQAMNTREATNFEAFARYIPSIAEALPSIKYERLSVFVDKNGQANIVNVANGTTLYDLNVDENIAQQADNWPFFSGLLQLNASSLNDAFPQQQSTIVLKEDSFTAFKNYSQQIQKHCKVNTPDALVVLGLGKGSFLPHLIREVPAKQLVIYEPDWEVFRCSIALFDWANLLEHAQQKGIQLFLQIGNNIFQIYNEINELHTQLAAQNILFYQHQVNPVYCQILKSIRQGKWHSAIAHVNSQGKEQLEHEHLRHHLRYFNSLNPINLHKVSSASQLFVSNMALFAEHYPDIHAAFDQYEAKCWETVQNQVDQHINVFNCDSMSFLAGEHPDKEGEMLAQHFSKFPNLDGLVFGHQGDKLKHYLHNRFVRKVDLRLIEDQVEKGELPDSIKMLLVFGLGTGQMLNTLYASHDVQNVCICEPNPDFFYASLHAFDWAPIFEKVTANEYKLYINIGEASSRLFKDLTVQFLNLGPHLLNETYIMQAYDNPLLRDVLTEVRQQLQVIFSMGENLDHVLYGISHTAQAVRDKIPALRANSHQLLSVKQRHLPIFIVGNGPSLDESIASIKEYQQQVIVVSCGTSLQALHRHGIVPDFHAEVEQNRANFDWVRRIGDPDYLKQINLLSVNGIHPDTYAMFKQTFMVFKTGESSTQAVLSMLPENMFASLDNAYPTVTNMVLSLFLKMGFEQIYLHGVDLGFADEDKHHSASSGYYENGQQVFNYKKIHNGVQRVKGNRQAWVYTKTEFNISRMIFEQMLSKYKAECFNLSNGAFVSGTIALQPEDILVVTNNEDKQALLESFNNCFMSIEVNIVELFNKAYSQEKLRSQVNELRLLTQQGNSIQFNEKYQVDELIIQLRDLLVTAKKEGKSLFFYYFFNSVNYLCAVLNKAIMHESENVWQSNCKQILLDWNRLMGDFDSLIAYQFDVLDTSECHSGKYEELALITRKNVPDLSYFTFSKALAEQHALYSQERSTMNDFIRIDELRIPSNGILIIDIFSEKEALQVQSAMLDLLQENKQDANKVALVFHRYALLNKFKQQISAQTSVELCFIYMPLIWQKDDFNSSIALSNICQQGYQDYVSRQDYFQFLHARAQDITEFALILYKARFNEAAAMHCKKSQDSLVDKVGEEAIRIERNLQYVENIHDFNHYYDEDSEITGNNEVLKAIDDSPSIKNEFIASGYQVVENKIIKHIDFDTYYAFKHYIAVYKTQVMNMDNKPITKLDNMLNRGLLTKRKPLAYEFFGQWYLN